ncbi:Dck1 protein [Saccharomycopsis crataegensis]|uniref:Dck1 protein n=1 Tax=Saccharomycopsis crataegensis TaxID=43959 RepID=A0AAV5QGG1_9ASCO|nr:Dck1 protein [Saccharomycopsis crataegensis]
MTSAQKWQPLPMLAHGRVVKSFLPQNHLDKLPSYFQNLYPGDEVYIFEASDKWARGYILVQPLPTDFIAITSNLEKLPDQRIAVVILPLSHVKIFEKIQIPKLAQNGDQKIMDAISSSGTQEPTTVSDVTGYNYETKLITNGALVSNPTVPTIYETELNATEAREGENINYHLKPPLPALRLDSGDLLDEITPAISLLSSHIYSLYSVGEFSLSLKLGSLYYELDEIRIKLSYNLCTKAEKNVARKSVALLLSKIAKLLSSKGINKVDRKSSAIKYDTAGYEAILARNPETGELFDYRAKDLNKQATPDVIAINQFMFALCSNYPLSDAELANLNPPANSKFKKAVPSQILVDFTNLISSSSVSPKGFIGMTAFLYLRNSKERLTEAFSVPINANKDLNMDTLSAALFRNIPAGEIDKGRIYLVALITEEIEIPKDSVDAHPKSGSNSHSISKIRKGVAAGVTDISRVFSRKGITATGESHHFKIKLFGSYINKHEAQTPSDQNFGWGELTDRIIRGSNKGVAVNPRAEKLVVSIKEFKSATQNFMSDFDTNGLRPIAQIRTMFYDPLVKFSERFYIKLGKVHVKASSLKGFPVTIQVTSNNNSISFVKGANQTETEKWQFPSVHSDESVGELIRVSGIGSGANSGLMSNAESDFLYFHAFINGEVVAEGRLLIRRGNQAIEYKKTHLVELNSAGNSHSSAVSFEITSEYVGKSFNVDHSVHTLLNWKNLISLPANEDTFIQLIKKFNNLDTSHLVKYFPELLTSLLEVYKASIDLSLPALNKSVFESIVHVLDFVIARKDQYVYFFENFIKNATNLPSVGFYLLSKMEQYFSSFQTSWEYFNRSVCRVSTLILRLAIKTTDSKTVDSFINSWKSFLSSIATFLSSKDKNFTSDQSYILEVIDLWLDSLRTIFMDEDTLNFGIILIDSVGIRGLSTVDVSGGAQPINKRNDKVFGFIITKLLLIRRLLHSWVVETPACRDKLILTSINWAMEVLVGHNDMEASRLANGILVSICSLCWDIIKTNRVEDFYLCRGVVRLIPSISEIILHYNKFARANGMFKPKRTFTTLFPTTYPFNEITMDSIVNDESFVEILIELMTLFAYMTKLGKHVCGEKGLQSLFQASISDTMFNKADYFAKSLNKEQILNIIQTSKLMIQSKCYPATKWLSLHGLLVEAGSTVFEMLKNIMISDHIPPVDNADQFDRLLWGNYLKTCMKFATAMPVAICHLADVPRKACWKISGDLRTRVCSLINEVWDCLAWDALDDDIVRFQLTKFGGYQVEFINYDYGVLQDLMLLSLQRQANCQEVGVKMLWTIIISEWLLNEKLIDIERECIVGLYEIFHSNRYKPGQYEERNFIKKLKSSIRIDPEDEAFEAIDSFIQNLYEFLEVLNDLENVPPGPEFDDDRTFHKLNINGFLKHVNKPELLHSFISEMVEGNVAKQNFVQAGLSLELLASTYDWNTEDKLPVCIKPKFPEQSSFERKEALMKMMAHNFVKGQALEKAIEVYKQLAHVYDTIKYDFKGLSYVHKQLSGLYLDLETIERLTPSYFRIAFIGYGFPKSVRGRQYIYEGYPFEHITSIHDRLLRLHPGAIIVSDDDEARKLSESIPSGRYLHITTVEPRVNVPQNISNLTVSARLYMENRNLTRFTNARRLPGSSSVMDLWVEETTYETYTSFPTLMNRSEIKSAITVKLSPLQNALRSLTSKTQELIGLETMANKAMKEKEDLSNIFSEMSRQLSGTIDAPVNGGIGQYRVFFGSESFTKNPAYALQLETLRIQFNELAMTIRRCLMIHAKLVPQSMQESQYTLVDLFKKNFEEEIRRIGIQTEDINNGISSHAAMLNAPSIQLPVPMNVHVANNGIKGHDYLRRMHSNSSDNSQRTDSTHSHTHSSHRTTAKRSVLNWRQSRNIIE